MGNRKGERGGCGMRKGMLEEMGECTYMASGAPKTFSIQPRLRGFNRHRRRFFCYLTQPLEVLLLNVGFCKGCITKQCTHSSTNVSYNDLVSRLPLWKKMKVYIKRPHAFLLFHETKNSGFQMNWNLKVQIPFCNTANCKIYRYVTSYLYSLKPWRK